MIKICLVEIKVMTLFKHSKMLGFIHSYIGEEAVASGILNQKDMITSTHRAGLFNNQGMQIRFIFAELV